MKPKRHLRSRHCSNVVCRNLVFCFFSFASETNAPRTCTTESLCNRCRSSSRPKMNFHSSSRTFLLTLHCLNIRSYCDFLGMMSKLQSHDLRTHIRLLEATASHNVHNFCERFIIGHVNLQDVFFVSAPFILVLRISFRHLGTNINNASRETICACDLMHVAVLRLSGDYESILDLEMAFRPCKHHGPS